VKVLGISWLGTRTDDVPALVASYRDVLGLAPDIDDEGFAVFRLPDGDVVEVFAADDPHHRHFDTGPVVGSASTTSRRRRRRWRRRGSSSSAGPSTLTTATPGRTSVRPTGTSTS
jgi:hypothetical protein